MGSFALLWLGVPTAVAFVSFVILHQPSPQISHWVTFLGGILFLPLSNAILSRLRRQWGRNGSENDGENTLYGLNHARLHVKTSSFPMWMNMGYWDPKSCFPEPVADEPTKTNRISLAVASRTLLSEVLKTAGFSVLNEGMHIGRAGRIPSRALLDLGFGCGEQTMYLCSSRPVRESDEEWWGSQSFVPDLDFYVGITNDRKQYQYSEIGIRLVAERLSGGQPTDRGQPPSREQHLFREQPTGYSGSVGPIKVRLFCADASNPDLWEPELSEHVQNIVSQAEETWVLALDTLYHFSPSRWPTVTFTCRTLKASFMAFDLCLADNISLPNLVLLRIVTKLMGAPWANFGTIGEYQSQLKQAGYQYIKVRDVSEHVFGPLAAFMETQDAGLKAIGHGLGPFHVAKWMFGWWARTGIIRGVIVVAKR